MRIMELEKFAKTKRFRESTYVREEISSIHDMSLDVFLKSEKYQRIPWFAGGQQFAAVHEKF